VVAPRILRPGRCLNPPNRRFSGISRCTPSAISRSHRRNTHNFKAKAFQPFPQARARKRRCIPRTRGMRYAGDDHRSTAAAFSARWHFHASPRRGFVVADSQGALRPDQNRETWGHRRDASPSGVPRVQEGTKF
jgi:hypothetical protein